MPAGPFTLYDGVAEYMGDGTLDFDTNAFNITLHTSAYTPNQAHDVYADATNELPTANGYVSGGAALTGVTWAQVAGVAPFDSDNQVWTADGGPITARYGIVRQITPDKLLGYYLLDDAPADITATDGNTFTVGPSAVNGWFKNTVNPVL